MGIFSLVYVCPYVITFKSLDVPSSFLVCGDILSGYGQVHVNVIGSRPMSQQQKVRNSLLPQCKTVIGINSGSVEDIAVKFAYSVEISAVADRMT